MARALRADAERSARAILEAAERVLAEDAGASMEQIAEAAGLTRITVHRRFANRQALLEALSVSAMQQLLEAIQEARPNSAPALVALYRVTANVLRVKSAWRFTLNHDASLSEAAAALWAGSTPTLSNCWPERSARDSSPRPPTWTGCDRCITPCSAKPSTDPALNRTPVRRILTPSPHSSSTRCYTAPHQTAELVRLYSCSGL